MIIDIERLEDFHARGGLVRWDFGDVKEKACLVSALSGVKSFGMCKAAGWPQWLAEIVAHCFDNCDDDLAAWEWGKRCALAIKAADERGVDWDAVLRAVRLDSILPIALEACGEGSEPWRVRCRAVVQRCIDAGGVAAKAEKAGRAASAAWLSDAARAAWAAEAAEAEEGAGALRAARAAESAAGTDAAWRAANARIRESLARCIEQAEGRQP